MNAALQRARRLLPGPWAGALLCLAALAAPAAFALLPPADAGRLVGRMLAVEAHASLALGALLLVLERLAARRQALAGTGSQFSAGMLLALGTLLCTIVGYFVLQPMMAAARAGQGGPGFGSLHAASAALFGVKLALVAALAWRVSRPSCA